MNGLYKLLDRLESVVMDGIPIPFLPYSLINQDKILTLLDKIQTAIPEEVQQAEQLLGRQEELQMDAQRRAQYMLQEAKIQAERMVSESELLQALQFEAERVRQQLSAEMNALREKTLQEVEEMKRSAYEEAVLVQNSADEYADRVLKTLSQQLDEFQNIAKNANKHLKKVRTEALQQQYKQGVVLSTHPSPQQAMPQNNAALSLPQENKAAHLPPLLNRYFELQETH
jgi:hypothetical protein